MTVKEVIEELKKYPEDMRVEVCAPCGYENAGGEVECITLEKDYLGEYVEILG